MRRTLPLLTLLCVLACGIAAPAANAAFGFVTSSSAPALAPNDQAFWAGTCDLTAAPAVGVPIPGGIGTRPSTIHQANTTAPVSSEYVNPDGPFNGVPIPLSAPTRPEHCIDDATPVQGIPAWFALPSWRLPAAAQAGARPDGSATLTFDRPVVPLPPNVPPYATGGSVDNIMVDLPPGFVGNPRALPKCTAEQFAVKPVQCPPETQVGVANIATREELVFGVLDLVYPVYNLEPRQGRVAELGIPDVAGFTSVRIVAKARTNGDFGVTTFVPQIPAALELYSQTISLWGVPWAEQHDAWRPREFVFGRGFGDGKLIPHSGLAPADQAPYETNWGAIKPFIANPTECDAAEPPVTDIAIDSYENPGSFLADGDPDLTDLDWKTEDYVADPVTGCAGVDFDPNLEIVPTSNAADSATGLDVSLDLPQNNDPPQGVRFNPDDTTGAPAHWRSAAGRATAQLDQTVVTLPPGVAVNPSGAAGLAGCSDAQIGLTEEGSPPLFNNEDPFDGQGAECPAGSKIGTAEVKTPLLAEALTGEVVLGAPKPGDVGSENEPLTFRLYVVARNVERGLLAKVFGNAVADPTTGQLTATFEKNPRVPFDSLKLHFKGGDRAQLAQPQQCGSPSWTSTLTPWTAAHGGGGVPVADGGAFSVGGDCSLGFAPKLNAGMSTPRGGANGTFSFSFSRADGERWFKAVTAELPTGLVGSVKGVLHCTNAQAAQGACPAASRIGTADAGAGSGSPFFLERKGDVYLTDSYKGGTHGLAVVVPVEAGPFRGEFALKQIVVRQALHVDPDDASVTVISDDLPTIWHGIPLRVRQVTVNVDRPGFMVNPTGCAPKRIGATIASVGGATADLGQPFQAKDCGRLPFKPKLALRLVGKKQVTRGKHPELRAALTQGRGQANTSKAEVRLPLSLALDPRNSTDPKLLCSYDGGLAGSCPDSSIIGRARAVTPLLDQPLSGPVHLVQGIRFGPTGNRIRTLPTLLVKLRGEVDVNLRGASSVKDGRLVNTFSSVPDAAVSSFNLKINGGKKGLLVVTGRSRRSNICGRQVTDAYFDGHNGRQRDFEIRMKTPCKRLKSARRKAR